MHEAETMEAYHASRILKTYTNCVQKQKKKYNNYFAHCTIIWSVETLENGFKHYYFLKTRDKMQFE